MSEVEKLANVIDRQYDAATAMGMYPQHKPAARDLARVVLASDWLAAHDAKVRAEGAAEAVERVEQVLNRCACEWVDSPYDNDLRRVPTRCPVHGDIGFVRELRAALGGSAQSPAHRADCPATHYPDRPERCRCVFMAMIEEMRPAHGEGMRDV